MTGHPGLRAVTLGFCLLAARSEAAGPESGPLPLVIHLADGSSLPLREWTLSYEYLAWPAGSPQALASPARREAQELWVGKRRLDTSGLVLEIEYAQPGPGGDASGEAAPPAVRRLRVRPPGGKPSELKLEPPHRGLLLPEAGRELLLTPRSLDLRGQTVTGTRRELCLLSYTVLVQCGGDGSQVVKIEFPPKE